MNAEHFDELLKGLQEQQPFQKFAIELNTGKRYEFDNRFSFAFRKGSMYFFNPDGSPAWLDHENVTQVVIQSPKGDAP